MGLHGCAGQDVGEVGGRRSRVAGSLAFVGIGLGYGRPVGNRRVLFGRGVRWSMAGKFEAGRGLVPHGHGGSA